MNHSGFYYLKFKITDPFLYINKTKVKVSHNCYHACVLYAHEKAHDTLFNDNFKKSLQKLLPVQYKNIDLNQINFAHLKNIKLTCDQVPSNYGNVSICGKKYKLNNFIVEPLHIFKGRGNHPLRGTLKIPVLPEQITLNAVNTPQCCLSGHTWGNVINNASLQWAGFYKDSLGQSKYMYPMLNDELSKFETARKLKKKLHGIRKQYILDLCSEKINTRQKATALYLIDKMCIRIGHPKEIDSADTVGCCTLRVEHLKINGQSITFCFLGKDSIEFKKTIVPHEIVLKNIKDFVKQKNKHDLIFCKIDASILSTYLNKLHKGLTAKQFRTCHASNKFQQLLDSYNSAIDEHILKYYKYCNTKVAQLCNHKTGDKISNETSKANYIDPRIVFSFAKKHNIDINKLYSPSLIEKHSWASSADTYFKF